MQSQKVYPRSNNETLTTTFKNMKYSNIQKKISSNKSTGLSPRVLKEVDKYNFPSPKY